VVEDYRERLPALERDVIYLVEDLRRTQSDCARILGISQPTVSYRYQRSRQKIAHLSILPKVTPYEVRAVLAELGAKESDIRCWELYVEFNSQTAVSEQLERSQGWVRYNLSRGLDLLKADLNPADRHTRVRNACQMLYKHAGLFLAPDKITPQLNERPLPEKPKLKGPDDSGQSTVDSGLYMGLRGVRKGKEIEINLASQTIVLRWS
jgi:hypothetical protein